MKKGLFLIVTAVCMVLVCAFMVGAVTDAPETTVLSGLSAKNQVDGIYIKWKSVENASGYKIIRTDENGGENILEESYAKTSYEDVSASSGGVYIYTVIPLVGEGEEVSGSSVSVMRISQPKLLSAVNTVDGVAVTWEKVNGADRYTLYRKGEGEEKWTSLGTVKNTDSKLDKKAASGKKYTYTVIARGGDCKSSYDKAGITLDVLKAPVINTIKAINSGIYLKWSKVSGAESYVIYRRAAGEKWSYLTVLPAGKLSFTDTTMTPGYTYAYTVRAVNSLVESAYNSGEAYRFIPINDVTTVKNAEKGLTVKWYASPYASGYKLYRKADGAEKWTRIAVLNGKTKTSYTDTKVKNGETYTYTLITVYGKYQSTYRKLGESNRFVAPPITQIAVKSGSGYRVEWLKVPGATHYYVYRSDSENGPWQKLVRVRDINSYIDKTADKTQKYYYCVRAGVDGKYFSTYGISAMTSNIDPDKKMVALTYDDGPHGTYTAQILDVLEKYDSRATFFVVGSRIEYYPEQITRAYELGCEIGSHTYNHINLPSYTDSSIKSEMNKTDSLIKKYTGEVAPVMRPPGGATSSRSLAAVGKPAIMWSVDTRDWDHRNATRTVNHIKNNVYDGAIVLMHDLYSPTAEATKTIVPWLIDNGYQLVTVSELMYYRGITMKPGSIYRSARP